jgi:hypothetical protein
MRAPSSVVNRANSLNGTVCRRQGGPSYQPQAATSGGHLAFVRYSNETACRCHPRGRETLAPALAQPRLVFIIAGPRHAVAEPLGVQSIQRSERENADGRQRHRYGICVNVQVESVP